MCFIKSANDPFEYKHSLIPIVSDKGGKEILSPGDETRGNQFCQEKV